MKVTGGSNFFSLPFSFTLKSDGEEKGQSKTQLYSLQGIIEFTNTRERRKKEYKANTHTVTHSVTHTWRERERERDLHKCISFCPKRLLSTLGDFLLPARNVLHPPFPSHPPPPSSLLLLLCLLICSFLCHCFDGMQVTHSLGRGSGKCISSRARDRWLNFICSSRGGKSSTQRITEDRTKLHTSSHEIFLSFMLTRVRG